MVNPLLKICLYPRMEEPAVGRQGLRLLGKIEDTRLDFKELLSFSI